MAERFHFVTPQISSSSKQNSTLRRPQNPINLVKTPYTLLCFRRCVFLSDCKFQQEVAEQLQQQENKTAGERRLSCSGINYSRSRKWMSRLPLSLEARPLCLLTLVPCKVYLPMGQGSSFIFFFNGLKFGISEYNEGNKIISAHFIQLKSIDYLYITKKMNYAFINICNPPAGIYKLIRRKSLI